MKGRPVRFEISVRSHFSAAHRLVRQGGPCENLHGHNWIVEAGAASDRLDPSGMVMDFATLKAALAEALSGYDHTLLNDHPDFRKMPPTAEHLAHILLERMAGNIDNDTVKIAYVRVWETEGCCATARPAERA